MKKFIVCILLAIAVSCDANQPNSVLGCPQVTVPDNIVLDDFLTGKWYDIESYPDLLTLGSKCAFTEYRQTGNGGVAVANQQVGRIFGIETVIRGTGKTTGTGTFTVSYPMKVGQPMTYSVLGADQDFAVLYTCGLSTISLPKVWIMSRTHQPDAATLDKAYAVLDTNNLSKRHLVKIDQTGCLN